MLCFRRVLGVVKIIIWVLHCGGVLREFYGLRGYLVIPYAIILLAFYQLAFQVSSLRAINQAILRSHTTTRIFYAPNIQRIQTILRGTTGIN